MRTIDADKLKKVLEKNFGHTGGASVLAQLIDAQPTVELKRGKWLYQNGMVKCDQCLRAIRRIDHDGLLNFCPNCGADMIKRNE